MLLYKKSALSDSDVYRIFHFVLSAAMEKQLEDLKQQLEKQCQINQELQRQNTDLGEHRHNITDKLWRKSPGKQAQTFQSAVESPAPV